MVYLLGNGVSIRRTDSLGWVLESEDRPLSDVEAPRPLLERLQSLIGRISGGTISVGGLSDYSQDDESGLYSLIFVLKGSGSLHVSGQIFDGVNLSAFLGDVEIGNVEIGNVEIGNG